MTKERVEMIKARNERVKLAEQIAYFEDVPAEEKKLAELIANDGKGGTVTLSDEKHENPKIEEISASLKKEREFYGLDPITGKKPEKQISKETNKNSGR